MRIKVISKSSIIPYGNLIRQPRIGLLLQCKDHFQNIKASAFDENVDYINDSLEIGMQYNISGYILRTSDYSSPSKEIILSKATIIELAPNEESMKENIEATRHDSYQIADITNKIHVRQLRTVGPVIITSVGLVRTPNVKPLKEIMIKDETGEIIFNLWGMENINKFHFNHGEVIELRDVVVDLFKSYTGDEYSLNDGDVATFVRKPCNDMQCLLENEDPHYLTPKTMTILEIIKLKERKHLIIIDNVKIESFGKHSDIKMIVKHCDIDWKHGRLIEKDGRWYCEDCSEFQDGEDKVQLTAKIVNFPIISNRSLWVKFFDKSARIILGKDYDVFRESTNVKKTSILRKIEKKETVFKVEIKFKPDFDFKIVTKVEIIQ